MRSTRFGRGLLLGLALACTLTALGGGAFALWHPGPACEDLDPETCLIQVHGHEELRQFASLAAVVLGLAGPLLLLVWRDAERRADGAAS